MTRPRASADPGGIVWTSIEGEAGDGVVVVTRFVPGDAAVMMEGDADPEHRLRFGAPADFTPSLSHSERIIAAWQEEFERGESFSFAVRHARTGELLGGCQLKRIQVASANLSYWTFATT